MARGAARALALLAFSAGAFDSVAAAQPRADLARVESQRRAADAETARLQRDARAARTRIDALAAQVTDARRRREEADRATAEAEARRSALEARRAEDADLLSSDRRALESLVMAAAFAERSGQRPATARAAVFAQAMAPSVTRRLSATAFALAEAQRIGTELDAEQLALAEARIAIDAARMGAEAELAQQRTRREALETRLADAQRRAQRLAREARSLRELASRVTQPRASSRGTASASAALPASWTAPASGRIVRAYGAREGAGPAAQGATLAVRAGAEVRAPAAAEVAYAGVFRGYGQVLILNLDGGYAVVLTGMDSLRARTGERVATGQTVGVMGSAATPAPELYVEVRRGGQTVDPGRWLAARGATLAQAN